MCFSQDASCHASHVSAKCSWSSFSHSHFFYTLFHKETVLLPTRDSHLELFLKATFPTRLSRTVESSASAAAMLPIQILSFALSLFSVGCAATATATTTNESSAVTIELPKLHMEGQLINVNSTIGIVVGTASFMAQSSTDTSTFTCGGHYTLTQTDYRMTTTETVASATTTLKDQASKRTDDPLAAICDTNDPEETTACLKLKDALESLVCD